jgi:hypothetical protein
VADTVIGTAPRTDGFQEQVAVNIEPDPLAVLFLQPVIITLAALKVTFDATETLTEITTGVRKLAVVAFEGSETELNDAISDPGPAGGNAEMVL